MLAIILLVLLTAFTSLVLAQTYRYGFISGSMTICKTNYYVSEVSNVDSSADKGTHSNFTAQQYGPDLTNDTLTEENTGGGSTNYELDLEVQWTNVDFDETNEELCICGGVMGSENLRVDVWNGSSWQNAIATLSSGWNNVTVSAYLVSSTFTIRFNGSIETADGTQDNWAIDTTLLHVWT